MTLPAPERGHAADVRQRYLPWLAQVGPQLTYEPCPEGYVFTAHKAPLTRYVTIFAGSRGESVRLTEQGKAYAQLLSAYHLSVQNAPLSIEQEQQFKQFIDSLFVTPATLA